MYHNIRLDHFYQNVEDNLFHFIDVVIYHVVNAKLKGGTSLGSGCADEDDDSLGSILKLPLRDFLGWPTLCMSVVSPGCNY